jgi:mannose-6-phosphate isomerase class I
MSSKEYDAQRKKEAEITRQLALADVKEWMRKIPADKKEKPAIVVGSKTFTPAQIAKEVENDTEYGKQFSRMLQRSRMELTKRRE